MLKKAFTLPLESFFKVPIYNLAARRHHLPPRPRRSRREVTRSNSPHIAVLKRELKTVLQFKSGQP